MTVAKISWVLTLCQGLSEVLYMRPHSALKAMVRWVIQVIGTILLNIFSR